jgi:uncharacterized membrane protein
VDFESFARTAVQVVEGVGVAILVGGVLVVLAVATVRAIRGSELVPVYREARVVLGRVLLLGIEVLVAGDIIRTVAIELTLVGVAELGGIVLIRTFLSWAIELETEGRWPWQQPQAGADPAAPATGTGPGLS